MNGKLRLRSRVSSKRQIRSRVTPFLGSLDCGELLEDDTVHKDRRERVHVKVVVQVENLPRREGEAVSRACASEHLDGHAGDSVAGVHPAEHRAQTVGEALALAVDGAESVGQQHVQADQENVSRNLREGTRQRRGVLEVTASGRRRNSELRGGRYRFQFCCKEKGDTDGGRAVHENGVA